MDKLLELAEGVHIQQINKERPDRQAAACLIDRILGKPAQPVSLSSTVREMAAAAGLSDEETAEAVAEAA